MEEKTESPPTPPHPLLDYVRKELHALPKAVDRVLKFTPAKFSPAVLLKGRVHALKDVPNQYRRVYTEITLAGTKQYPGPHLLLLEMPSEYPGVMPDVRFISGMQHFAVHHDSHRPMGAQFIELCTPPGEKVPTFSLRRTLAAVLELLTRPLHPCKHCTPNFMQSVKAQAHLTSVQELYRRKFAKHKELFTVPAGGVANAWFAPELRAALTSATPATALKGLVKQEAPGIFSFPMFTQDFCTKLVAEVDSVAASGIPVQRPNSMNNYGVILNFIGMRGMFTWLQRQVLQPIAALLFPQAGQFLDSHHTFIVQYSPKQDLGLDMHVDNSDVTFNVCLGKKFTGAPLNFCGVLGQSNHRRFTFKYKHVMGRCVVHLGSQRHGAADIITGERYNLIMWNTSTVYRESVTYKERSMQRFYRKEEGPPDRVCLSFTHDRDYGRYLKYPEGKEHFKETAWCPPKHAEYTADEALGALA